MLRPLTLLCALLLANVALSAETSFQLQTESQLTLSISQEAEEAIDRAQRWLRATATPPPHHVEQLLHDFALANPSDAPIVLYRCDLTPLEHAMPQSEDEILGSITNLTTFIETERPSMKRLFALQRDLPQTHALPNWRETITLAIINAQKVTPQGGHWGSPEETRWAILALRSLLNESVPIRLAE